jgi:hypothetical protein
MDEIIIKILKHFHHDTFNNPYHSVSRCQLCKRDYVALKLILDGRHKRGLVDAGPRKDVWKKMGATEFKDTVLAALPKLEDVEEAGELPPSNPYLAGDQARNFTINQIRKIIEGI